MKELNYILTISIFIFAIGCKNEVKDNNTEKTGVDSTKVEQTKDGNSLEKLNEAIVKDPNNSGLYYERAKAYYEAKFPDDALYDINRALGLDSLNPDYLLYKSDLLFKRGKGIEAKKLIDKSIEHNPDHIESYLWLAEIQLYTNQNVESIKNINNALRVDVYNAKAYFLKGMNYKYVGDTAIAVSSFQTAVEQDPEYYDAYMQLGILYASVNDPLAVSYYNNAIKVRPNSIEAIYAKSLFLQENEKLDQAIMGYRLINTIDPSYQQSYYNIGFIKLVMQQEYDSAIFYFNKVLSINPGYFDAAYNIGYSYELKGDKDIAKQFYQKTLRSKPDHTLAAKGLGRVQ